MSVMQITLWPMSIADSQIFAQTGALLTVGPRSARAV